MDISLNEEMQIIKRLKKFQEKHRDRENRVYRFTYDQHDNIVGVREIFVIPIHTDQLEKKKPCVEIEFI